MPCKRKVDSKNIEELAEALILWASTDECALNVMQFCRRENIMYRELLQLDYEMAVHIDVYEKIMGGHLEKFVKELLRCTEGDVFPINFYKMARDRLGNRRYKGAIYYKYESSIAMKTQWLYDDEWGESDNYYANLNGIKPQRFDVVKQIVIKPIRSPFASPGEKQSGVTLSKELIEKINILFIDLLRACKQENAYSVVDAVDKMGSDYDNVKSWAHSKKGWLEILDECHRYCFCWAEIAGLTSRISATKALKYMCENDDNFKNHLEWRKAWEEKPWKKQKPVKKITSQQHHKITLL